MTYIDQLSATGARFSGRRAKRAMTGAVLASLLATVLAALPVGVAGASSVGGAQAQISALQAQVAAGATQIHEFTESYDHASLQAASLQQQLETQYAQLGTLRHELDHSQTTLRQAALRSYTGDTATALSPAVAATTNPAIGDEYLSVASGDVGNTIDVYQLRQRQVATAIRTISAEQRANRHDLDAASSARLAALTAAGSEQQRLTSLEGRLAAAERAARAASQATRAATATQGSPVNDGIVKVTRALTSPVTAPTSRPAPTTSTTTPSGPSTTTPPATTAPTTPTTTTPSGGSPGVWLELRTCESGDDYTENTGNGFYGAYQFSASTWTGLGYPGRPDLEPPAMQDAAAMKLQAESGWGQWPSCAAALGLT